MGGLVMKLVDWLLLPFRLLLVLIILIVYVVWEMIEPDISDVEFEYP